MKVFKKVAPMPMLFTGNLPAAISDYTYAIELNNNNAAAYAARGRALYESGDAHSAYQDFSYIIRQNSAASADVYYYRGLL